MRTEQHFRNMLVQNPNASIGFTLAASMIYAARYGVCETEHHGTDEWKNIARSLKSKHGETLAVDDVTVEMDKASKSAAAASLGSITSERKAQAARENGKKGGRPRETMIIKAIRRGNGKWIMQAENGDIPQEGFEYDTRQEVYIACFQMYPTNSVWQGHKTDRGYRITI